MFKIKNIKYLLLVIASFLMLACSQTSPIKAPTLVSVIVTPLASAGTQVPSGLSYQLSAEGVYSDGTRVQLNSGVAWSVSATTATDTTISQTGMLSAGNNVGAVTATASVGGISGSTVVSIVQADLISISLSPASESIPVGVPVNLAISATYSNGTYTVPPSAVTLTSSESSVLSVDANGVMNPIESSSTPVTITASFQGKTSSVDYTVVSAVIKSILVSSHSVSSPTPRLSQMLRAESTSNSVPTLIPLQYNAIAVYTDGTTQDITTVGTWSVASSCTGCTIGANTGLFTAGNTPNVSGAVSIAYDNQSGAAVVEVNNATVTNLFVARQGIESTSFSVESIPVGIYEQFLAVAVYSDKSVYNVTPSATWTTGNPSVISVESGMVLAESTLSNPSYSTTLNLAWSGATTAVNVVVVNAQVLSITVSPELELESVVPAGVVANYRAFGYFTNGESYNISNNVQWSSTSGTIGGTLAISSSGAITTQNAGYLKNQINSFTIQASMLGGISQESTILGAESFGVAYSAVVSLVIVDPFSYNSDSAHSSISALTTESFAYNESGVAYSVCSFNTHDTVYWCYANNVNPNITWTSSNPSILTVTGSGQNVNGDTTNWLGTISFTSILGSSNIQASTSGYNESTYTYGPVLSQSVTTNSESYNINSLYFETPSESTFTLSISESGFPSTQNYTVWMQLVDGTWINLTNMNVNYIDGNSGNPISGASNVGYSIGTPNCWLSSGCPNNASVIAQTETRTGLYFPFAVQYGGVPVYSLAPSLSITVVP